MDVVLFAAGSPSSVAALEALATKHRILAVVVPARGWFRQRDFVKLAKSMRVPIRRYGPDLPNRLQSSGAELFCIASFPHVLGERLRSIPRFGTLNVHPSLLPRHRGADPLFWTYFCDDREAGVSVHWVSDSLDTGDIARQASVPLERGRPVADLYRELAQIGAGLLLEVIDDLNAGTRRAVQDEQAATTDARPRPGAFQIDVATWPSERVWHVLRGLGHRRHDLLGGEIHGPAIRYVVTDTARPAGSMERLGGSLRLYCADGYVDVEYASLSARAINFVRKIFGRSHPSPDKSASTERSEK